MLKATRLVRHPWPEVTQAHVRHCQGGDGLFGRANDSWLNTPLLALNIRFACGG